MYRRSDLPPLATIVAGTLLALAAAGSFATARREPSDVRARPVPAAPERPSVRMRPLACGVPFHVTAEPSDWSVVGTYDGAAALSPKGLVVQLDRGVTLAAERDVSVRALVIGIARETDGGGWFVAHASDPIPVGALVRGIARPLRPTRVLVAGVTAADLAGGWLVVEHVLDAPDVEGGTAWTYLHAGRTALHPLLEGGCAP